VGKRKPVKSQLERYADWRRYAWPAKVWLSRDGLMVDGYGERVDAIQLTILDVCEQTGESPWQVATRGLHEWLGAWAAEHPYEGEYREPDQQSGNL
jgi:hypothetical protein